MNIESEAVMIINIRRKSEARLSLQNESASTNGPPNIAGKTMIATITASDSTTLILGADLGALIHRSRWNEVFLTHRGGPGA